MARSMVGFCAAVLLAGCGDEGWHYGAGTSGGAGGGPGPGPGEPEGPCLPLSLVSEALVNGGDISAARPLPGGDVAVLIRFGVSDEPASIDFAGVYFGLPDEPDGASGALVVRLRPDASIAWATLVEGTGAANDALDLRVDHQGNIYVVGLFFADELTVGTATIERRTSQGTRAIFAVKLRGADGGVHWAESFGEYGDDVKALPAAAVSPEGDLLLSLAYESRFHFGAADYAGVGSAVLASVSPAGEAAWSISLPSADHLARSVFGRPGGGFRALGDYDGSWSLHGFEVDAHPGFLRRSYILDITTEGAVLAAAPIEIATDAKITQQTAVALSADYALTTASGNGEIDQPVLTPLAQGPAVSGGAARPERAYGLTQDATGRALIAGVGDTCNTEWQTVVIRYDEKGTMTGRVAIDRSTPWGIEVADGGEMVLIYGDRLLRTEAMPEAP